MAVGAPGAPTIKRLRLSDLSAGGVADCGMGHEEKDRGMKKRAWRCWKTCVAGAAAAAALWATPALLLAAAQGEKHEPGIINLDKSMILQVINLLILLFVLQKFLFKPLTQFLAKRAEGIKQSLDEARLAREAAAKAQEEYRAQLAATQREAAALRERAQREVEEERQRLLRASREEAHRLVTEAREVIEQETKRARAQLREDAVNLSVAVAERLLERSITSEDQRRLAEKYVREVGGQN
jgi:F-type H+-transporting ATPase subunit b